METENIPDPESPQTESDRQKREVMVCLRNCWHHNPIKFAFWAGFSLFMLIIIMAFLLEYSYRPQSCIVCHEMKPAHDTWKNSFHSPLKGGVDDCLGCHTAPGFGSKIMAKLGGMAFLWDHVIGNLEDDIKAKLPVYCVRSGCHTDPWRMDKGSKIRVNHALHISKGYGCVVCHDRIAHGADPNGLNLPGMKDFCFPCHNDEIASRSNCHFCHVYQDAMFMAVGGEGILQGDISAHRQNSIACVDCHTEGCEPKPVDTCLECHRETDILDFRAEQKWIAQSLKTLKEGIPKLAKAIGESENMGQDISQLNGIYNLVKEVHTFIKADASEGAHNMAYTKQLLNDALNRLNFAYLLIDQKKKRL